MPIFKLTLYNKQLFKIPIKMLSNQIAVKAGPIKNNTFGPGLTVILLIGPLTEMVSLIFSHHLVLLQQFYE